MIKFSEIFQDMGLANIPHKRRPNCLIILQQKPKLNLKENLYLYDVTDQQMRHTSFDNTET